MKKYSYIDVENAIDDENIAELERLFALQPKLLYDENVFDTPLHYCAGNGSAKTCNYLVQKGLDVNISIEGDETPLNEAAGNNNLETAEWLLAHGACVNGVETAYISPIFDAVYRGDYFEMVKLLVEHGANVNRIHINNGKLPLDVAMERKRTKCEQYLREHGALSYYDKPKWVDDDTPGSGILSHITLTQDIICPVNIKESQEDTPVVQKLVYVNKRKNRMLFTFGMFQICKPYSEFVIVLPERWNPYIKTAENQFPIELLSRLVHLVKSGFSLKEGTLISSDDERFYDLAWLDDIGALLVCNVRWKPSKPNSDDVDDTHDDVVFLYTLIPIRKTKSGLTKYSIEECRNAGWQKQTLKINKASI